MNTIPCPISINFLLDVIKPSQSDIVLLQALSNLNATRYSGQVFCTNVPNLPVAASLAILPTYFAVNCRDDKPYSVYFANSWRTLPVLRELKNKLHKSRIQLYLYCDCPEWLYPSERKNFVSIVNAYKSEFPVIVGAERYYHMLRDMGCNVVSCVPNYNMEKLVELIQSNIIQKG